jgi:hypothetical protein
METKTINETKSHKQYLRELSEREKYRQQYSREYVQNHPSMNQIIRIYQGQKPTFQVLLHLMKNILRVNHPQIQNPFH